MTSIKVEPSQHLTNGQNMRIKPDPEPIGTSPAAHTEEDIYEDAGDLNFAGSEQGVYLTRLPRFLWEKWSKLDDNQEIRIGTVRVEGTPGDIKRMSIMLAPDLVQNKDVPKEYNMHMVDQDSMNTFIFTEKDLPGYRQYSHDRAPPRFKDRKRVEKNKRPYDNYRRAIPKQTTLAGQVRTEINCLPVENIDYQQYMERLRKKAKEEKPKLNFTNSIIAGSGGLLNPGILGSALDTKNFIKQTGQIGKKRQENKAARMPQNELLDLLLDCFTQFKYWHLKTLKAKLNQPEAFLKETLDKVAVLTRSGTHNLTYQLREDANIGHYDLSNVKLETAPEIVSDGLEDVGGTEDDDENVKMEDVLPR